MWEAKATEFWRLAHARARCQNSLEHGAAKAIGFGRRRAAAEPSPPATERPVTRRRGRPRRTPPAT